VADFDFSPPAWPLVALLSNDRCIDAAIAAALLPGLTVCVHVTDAPRLAPFLSSTY